jgi:hypothetical protein
MMLGECPEGIATAEFHVGHLDNRTRLMALAMARNRSEDDFRDAVMKFERVDRSAANGPDAVEARRTARAGIAFAFAVFAVRTARFFKHLRGCIGGLLYPLTRRTLYAWVETVKGLFGFAKARGSWTPATCATALELLFLVVDTVTKPLDMDRLDAERKAEDDDEPVMFVHDEEKEDGKRVDEDELFVKADLPPAARAVLGKAIELVVPRLPVEPEDRVFESSTPLRRVLLATMDPWPLQNIAPRSIDGVGIRVELAEQRKVLYQLEINRQMVLEACERLVAYPLATALLQADGVYGSDSAVGSQNMKERDRIMESKWADPRLVGLARIQHTVASLVGLGRHKQALAARAAACLEKYYDYQPPEFPYDVSEDEVDLAWSAIGLVDLSGFNPIQQDVAELDAALEAQRKFKPPEAVPAPPQPRLQAEPIHDYDDIGWEDIVGLDPPPPSQPEPEAPAPEAPPAEPVEEEVDVVMDLVRNVNF